MSTSENYALIKTGGKQYRVSVGTQITIEKISAEAGSNVTFDQVLAIRGDSELQVGDPLIKGATVTGKILRQKRGPKLNAFKKLRRKGMTKKIGHRQYITDIEIASITAG